MTERRTAVYHFCQTCWFVKNDQKAEAMAYNCCNCGFGPHNLALYTSCINCGHNFRLPTPIVSYDYVAAGYDSEACRIAPVGKATDKETTISWSEATSPRTTPETEDHSPVDTPSQCPYDGMVPGSVTSTLNDETDGGDDGYSQSRSDDNCSTCPTTPESVDTQQAIPPMVSIESLVDDVMKSAYFVSTFQDFIANIVNHTANGGNSSSTSTNIERTALCACTTKSSTGTKRAQNDGTPPSDDDNDDDDDGDDEKDRRKRRKLGGTARKPVRKLVCPYFRRDPEVFKDDKSCSGPGWPDIHRLKQHLYRRHRRYQCDRCYCTFRSEPHLEAHRRELQSCDIREPQPIDPIGSFSKAQEQDLKSRKGYSTMTDVEKWNSLYKILFPDADVNRLPPAYIDAGERSATGRWRAENSMEYSHFESLSQELLALVRKKMADLAQKYSKDLEEKLNSQVPDILESSYREFVSVHRLENPFSAPGAEEQSTTQDKDCPELSALPISTYLKDKDLESVLFTTDLHPQDTQDAIIHVDGDAEYVDLESTISLPVGIVDQNEDSYNVSVGIEVPGSRSLTTEHQNASGALTRRESMPEYGNSEVRPHYAVYEPEMEQRNAPITEKFWEQWINADEDGDTAGSDYRQSYPSTVNLINGRLRTIDPRDLMQTLREE